jgi:Reverse transcriptase (RNA-dependent DNA polymerase)
VYLDDIFVYSRSVQEHQRHLELLFAWLCKHEFYLKQEKCELFADKVECLRHMIDEKGLDMDGDKMAKIWEWNRPHNFNDGCTEVFGPHTISGTFSARYHGIHWPIGQYDDEWDTILLEATA